MTSTLHSPSAVAEAKALLNQCSDLHALHALRPSHPNTPADCSRDDAERHQHSQAPTQTAEVLGAAGDLAGFYDRLHVVPRATPRVLLLSHTHSHLTIAFFMSPGSLFVSCGLLNVHTIAFISV